MNLENLQKERVIDFDGKVLNFAGLCRVLKTAIEDEISTTIVETESSVVDTTVAVPISITFNKQLDAKTATILIAEPKKAFACSTMLSRMLNEAVIERISKSILKLDQVLNCVMLHCLNDANALIFQLSAYPSNTSGDSLLILQKIIAVCFARIANAERINITNQEIEQQISTLRLYSFAWLCSVIRTLQMYPFAMRLERLFQFNIKNFLKRRNANTLCRNLANTGTVKDFYYVLMFLCSIGARRADAMDGLLKFLHQKKYIAAFKQCFSIFEQHPVDSRSLTTSNTALQIVEALNAYFKNDRDEKNTAVIVRTEAEVVLAMVSVFLSWLVKIVSKTTATERQQMLRAIVCFDQSVCEICCDSDTTHRKYLVTKFESSGEQRCCRMSYSDLCEWLRYMVLLQLDERNIHSKTEFYIYALPALYDFGPPPNLTFKTDGIDYLTFFLLESEFVRASLHQTRPKLRQIRESMLKDENLQSFIQKDSPFENYIVLRKDLLNYVAERYRLKTIQAVPQSNEFNY